MPDFPLVDTHVHLWDPERLSYPWLAGAPRINRPFLLPDYDEACGKVQVEQMVFLECGRIAEQALAEARWVQSLAAAEPRLQAIVAHAPLEYGADVAPHLEKLVGIPLVKGVRRLTQSESLDYCAAPDFIAGARLLPRFGLSFDLCIRHPQLADVIQLVSQCPETEFILDHIGKPAIADGLLEPWRAELRQLAAFPNVYCKLSGLVTEADPQGWTREQLKPYIEHVLDCFGFDRTVYGGDWPVVTLAAPYPQWPAALDWALAGCSGDELRRLYNRNAKKFYRLPQSLPVEP